MASVEGRVFDPWKLSKFTALKEPIEDLLPTVVKLSECLPSRSDTYGSDQKLNLWNETSDHFDCLASETLSLTLPDFEFELSPLTSLEDFDQSSISSFEDCHLFCNPADISFWEQAVAYDSALTTRAGISWEKFYQSSQSKPEAIFFSDKGEAFYDQVIADYVHDFSQILNPEATIVCLLQLSVGRESLGYKYDVDSRSFFARISAARISGTSQSAFAKIQEDLLRQGAIARRLQDFLTENSGLHRHAALAVLGRELETLLFEIETSMTNKSHNICSLLQLDNIRTKYSPLLGLLSTIQDLAASSTKETDFLQRLFDQLLKVQEAEALRLIVLRLLKACSTNWLQNISDALRLRPSHSISPCLSGVVPDEFPDFMPLELQTMISETTKQLLLLETHQPDNPLCRPITENTLQWQTTWNDVDAVVKKANDYQQSVTAALRDFCSGYKHVENDDSLAQSDMKRAPKSSVKRAFDLTEQLRITNCPSLLSRTSSVLANELLDTSVLPAHLKDFITPPMARLASLSFGPMINAQASLVAKACSHLIIIDNKLSLHLSILHRFFFLSDGLFSTRLSQALYYRDDEPTPGTHTPRFRRTAGLRLGHRKTWPPTGSDLRLALMNVLTDSYFKSHSPNQTSLFREDIPGDLTFGLRELSDSEMHHCHNPNSIHALDFLRLHYTPPAPLDLIITPTSIQKYDLVFKTLLRLHRILHVLENLQPRLHKNKSARRNLGRQYVLALRFRMESAHFISTLTTHFHAGISHLCHDLDETIHNTQSALNLVPTSAPNILDIATSHRDLSGTMVKCSSPIQSIPELAALHNDTLDKIHLLLFLRRRQSEISSLMHRIFGFILEIADQVNDILNTPLIASATTSAGANPGAKPENTIRTLDVVYTDLRKAMDTFVLVCRGLAARTGGQVEAGWMLDRLLLLLERW